MQEIFCTHYLKIYFVTDEDMYQITISFEHNNFMGKSETMKITVPVLFYFSTKLEMWLIFVCCTW